MLEYWDTKKTIHFPYETNGKLMVLGVPILKHFRVGHFDKNIKFIRQVASFVLPFCVQCRPGKHSISNIIILATRFRRKHESKAHSDRNL